MRHIPLATRIVRLEIQFAFRRRADSLNTKDLTPSIREPVYRFQRQAREIVLPARVIEMDSLVESHVQEHGIALPNLLSGFRQSLFHLSHTDRGFELHVREIKADGRGVEVFDRHLIDGPGARRGTEVFWCVDVGACVVAHGEGVGGALEDGVACFHGLVRVPWGDANGWVKWVCRAAVVDFPAEVDDFGFLVGGCGVGSSPYVGRENSSIRRSFACCQS